MIIQKIRNVMLLVACMVLPAQAENTWQLVSYQEYLHHLEETQQEHDLQLKNWFYEERNANAPVISLLVPEDISQINSPTDISIVFQALAGARIDISSFQVLYGWLNITDRIKKHAVIRNASISASKVKLPAGSHTITVCIEDNQGRRSEQDFVFRVK